MFQHCWYYTTQQFATQLQTRICINLNKPNFIVAIYHKIQTKNLKIMLSIIRIQVKICSFNSIQSNRLHLRIYHLTKTKISLSIGRIHISLKFIIGNFISFFILSITITVFLNSIISQMYYFISNLIYVKIIRRSPYITLTEPISTHNTVKSTNHHVMANIKFSAFIE